MRSLSPKEQRLNELGEHFLARNARQLALDELAPSAAIQAAVADAGKQTFVQVCELWLLTTHCGRCVSSPFRYLTIPESRHGLKLSIRRLHGACLCGAVEYVVEDAFEYAFNCHCSNCRRATGSAFKPLAGISRRVLSIVRGEDATMTYGEGEAYDLHCRTCGSLLYSVVRNGAYVHVPMGTLKTGPTIRPSMHIFVGSKAPWYQIADDLPQHDSFPPG